MVYRTLKLLHCIMHYTMFTGIIPMSQLCTRGEVQPRYLMSVYKLGLGLQLGVQLGL